MWQIWFVSNVSFKPSDLQPHSQECAFDVWLLSIRSGRTYFQNIIHLLFKNIFYDLWPTICCAATDCFVPLTLVTTVNNYYCVKLNLILHVCLNTTSISTSCWYVLYCIQNHFVDCDLCINRLNLKLIILIMKINNYLINILRWHQSLNDRVKRYRQSIPLAWNHNN